MINDFNGSCAVMDLEVTYADDRPSKQMRGITVCVTSGLLSCKTTARGRIKAGYNVLINTGECMRLGIDPEQAVIDQGPRECVLHLGENPGGLTVKQIDLSVKSKSFNSDSIVKNIEAKHGKTVASAWSRYKSSDRADEREDVFAAQILRAAGY